MRIVENLFGRRNDFDEGFARMARIEFFKEYHFLRKSLGREPTGRELRDFIG